MRCPFYLLPDAYSSVAPNHISTFSLCLSLSMCVCVCCSAGRLRLSQKLAYGLPNFATAAMFLPTSIHINKFFADNLLVPPGTLALGIFLSLFFFF